MTVGLHMFSRSQKTILLILNLNANTIILGELGRIYKLLNIIVLAAKITLHYIRLHYRETLSPPPAGGAQSINFGLLSDFS